MLKGSMTPELQFYHIVNIGKLLLLPQKLTGKNHHKSDVLVEDTVQESLVNQLVCKVKTGNRGWSGG